MTACITVALLLLSYNAPKITSKSYNNRMNVIIRCTLFPHSQKYRNDGHYLHCILAHIANDPVIRKPQNSNHKRAEWSWPEQKRNRRNNGPKIPMAKTKWLDWQDSLFISRYMAKGITVKAKRGQICLMTSDQRRGKNLDRFLST